ncbi:hypothetical protein MGYG_00088 [Nannizzia gypsea CBS 118893]|uniref:SUN domain-containing protein n=1 Tax=Arthroderma gypseum (strain ATCC MYA-4604 / CBS 118893) TaxID=535722 RepID=E5R2R0_ARTGP|nr:hypothetical protein MGYG_00088 [Nannizzia gypsea CBS 118893]EFQ97044.1 hypothetical protein MGYG_00088 [Nannizzia gypsea CBS 118893]
MAPQRRTRRATPTAAAPAAPEAENPFLPSIETQQSFAYGSSTPALPRRLGSHPSANNAEEVAATLSMSAGFHQIEDEARRSPEKQRRAESVLSGRETSLSPAPRETIRRLTPDIQLMGSLREASGEPEDHQDEHRHQHQHQHQQHHQQHHQQDDDAEADLLADAIDGSSISWNTERHLLATEQQQVSRRPANLGFPNWPARATAATAARRTAGPPMSPSQASSTSIQLQHLQRQQHLQHHQLRGQPQRSRATAERIERGTAIGRPVTTTTTAAGIATTTSLSPSGRRESASDGERVDTPQSEHTPSSSRPPSAQDILTPISPSTSSSSGLRLGFSHVITILLTVMVALNGYLLRDEIASAAKSIYLPGRGSSSLTGSNCTENISQMMTAVEQRLTTMTKDITLLKQEVSKVPEVNQNPHQSDKIKSQNKIQLAVELGQAIVPEEVIVEHMPREATLDNGAAAPQLMELWGEYEEAEKDEPLKERLARVWPGEPQSAYVNEPSLGPSFVRLGRWRYDIHHPHSQHQHDHQYHHIQRFPVQASSVIERKTKRVVVVARTNWGQREYTCIYRVRLHGRP